MKLFFFTITNSFLLIQGMGANEDPESSNFINIFIYFVLGLSLLINILFLSRKKKKRTKNTTSIGAKEGNDGWHTTLEANNKQLVAENKSLKNKLNSLQNKKAPSYEVAKDRLVENKLQPTVSSPTNEQENVDERTHTFDLTITKPKTIYLPSPFEDNRFSVEDVSSEQTPSSLYQIILDSSATTGKLSIIQNADFTRALNSPDHYLEKACVFENAFNSKAVNIQVIEAGKVKLENEDWLITDKIKIKFI